MKNTDDLYDYEEAFMFSMIEFRDDKRRLKEELEAKLNKQQQEIFDAYKRDKDEKGLSLYDMIKSTHIYLSRIDKEVRDEKRRKKMLERRTEVVDELVLLEVEKEKYLESFKNAQKKIITDAQNIGIRILGIRAEAHEKMKDKK